VSLPLRRVSEITRILLAFNFERPLFSHLYPRSPFYAASTPTQMPSSSPSEEKLFTRIIPTFSVGLSFASNPRPFPSFSTKRLEILTSNYIRKVFGEEYGVNHAAKVTLAFTEVDQRRHLQNVSNSNLYYLTYEVYGVVQFRNMVIDDYSIFSLLQSSVNTDTATDYMLNEEEEDYFPFLRSLIEFSISWDPIDSSEIGARATGGGTPVAPLTPEKEGGGLSSTFIAMILGGSVAIVAGLLLFAAYYVWSERQYSDRPIDYHDKTVRKTKKSESSNTSGDVPIDIILLEDMDSTSLNAWKPMGTGRNNASQSSQASECEISFPYYQRESDAQHIQGRESTSLDDSSRYQLTNNSGLLSSTASSIPSGPEVEDEKTLHDILDQIHDFPLERFSPDNPPVAPSNPVDSFIPIGDVELAANVCDSTTCSSSFASSLPPVDLIKNNRIMDLPRVKESNSKPSSLLERHQSVGEISSASSRSASTAHSFSLSSMLSKRSAAFLSTGTAKDSELAGPARQSPAMSVCCKSHGAGGLVRRVKDSLGLKNNEVFTSDMPRMLDEGASSISGSVDDNLFFPPDEYQSEGRMML
jgi:hypothetical protein